MGIKCLLGKHHFGLPRLDERGRLMRECLRCMRLEASRASLVPTAAEIAAQVQRRTQAIAELIANRTWVGLSGNVRDARGRRNTNARPPGFAPSEHESHRPIGEGK